MVHIGANLIHSRALLWWLCCCCWLVVPPAVGLENLLTSFEFRHGYVYPTSVTVAEGEVIHLRLLVPMQNGDQCVYREPGSPVDIDVHARDEESAARRRQRNVNEEGTIQRILENECGIRVNPVQQRDAGFWRLTLVRGAERIRGVSMVDVIERPSVPEVGIGGAASVTTLDEISPARTEYCYVQRQGAPSGSQMQNAVPMHERCQLPLSSTDPTGAGVWSVIAGVQGQMREMTYGIQIENKDEQIITTLHREQDYHVLSCHLRYTQLMLKFCRFLRLADGFGLNVIPGIGTSRYGYIGAGFERNECGLEILEPDGLDRGVWKCLLGYGDESITKVSGAIVDNSDTTLPLAIIGRDEMVAAQNDTTVSLQCNANKPIDYCWFRGPHGQFYSLSERLSEENADGHHWYSGISLAMGDCGLGLAAITEHEHAGRWQCYVGNGRVSALEVSAGFTVRVSPTQMIAAVDTIEATQGFPALLGCESIPRGTPLQYCRFVTPTGEAFSLNENVTSDRPVLERYYSNPNHDQTRGSCSLVIASVRTEDFGQWVCAGKIDGHATEHIAQLTVHNRDETDEPPEEPGPTGETLSAASIVGMAIGAVALVGGAVGLGFWQYRKRLHRQASAVNAEIQMGDMRASRRRISVISSESGSSTNSTPDRRIMQLSL
uniref:Immunoglobulin domain-containing protein n=1 Tax=Anopheles atroparvus TaxID=41427 RepID=A0AAG5DB61_ANOAO